MAHSEHFIDRLAKINGVLTGLALYLQIIHAVAIQSTEGLSTTAFALIFINSLVWIAYARHRRLMPLLVSSSLNVVASAVLVVLSID